MAKRKYKAMNAHDRGHTLCTDELIERVANFIRAGSYIDTACKSAGIHVDTYRDWLVKAQREPQKYPQCVKFSAAVDKAMADCEVKLNHTMYSHANGSRAIVDRATGEVLREPIHSDWKAAAWLLERRNPKRYGKVDRLEHSGPEGQPIETKSVIDPAKLSNEQLAQIQALLVEAGAEDPESEAD